jgi:hypothetical protein
MLNLSTRVSWLVIFMPCLFYSQRKSPSYAWARRISGPQFWSRYDDKRKAWHFREQNLVLTLRSLHTILTELPRLQ